MRKWKNLAAPDDPSAWYDLDGFVPTDRGTYEVADIGQTGTAYTATGVGTVAYAFYGAVPNPNTVNSEYVVDSAKIWRYDVSSLGTEMSDKTGTAGVLRPRMAKYGVATVCVMGSPRGSLTGAATVHASTVGGNFSALTGAPQGDCICVSNNAVIIANTDTANDEWAASDVGDYTNWTSGEAARARIYAPAGPITAAVEFNGAVYLFKETSIHRLRYVGGAEKYIVEKLYEGVGCSFYNLAIAGKDGILFLGGGVNKTGSIVNSFYWFDGVNPPVLTNPETDIGDGNLVTTGVMLYNRYQDLFTVYVDGDEMYFYNPAFQAWGRSTVSMPAGVIAMQGDARAADHLPRGWKKTNTNEITFYNLTGTRGTGARYIQTSKVGKVDAKTLFSRVTPLLRRRVDLGTDSAALEVTTFLERHDTTAATTTSVTESTTRKRFDFHKSDNFARFKVTFTDLDVEVDDFLIAAKPAGTD